MPANTYRSLGVALYWTFIGTCCGFPVTCCGLLGMFWTIPWWYIAGVYVAVLALVWPQTTIGPPMEKGPDPPE